MRDEGLFLHKRLLEAGKLPVGYSDLRSRRQELADIPPGREPEVKALLVKLDWNASDGQRRLALDLSMDLNLVRWHPEKSKEVLLKGLAGYVEDPETWLAGHIAWAQAEQLVQSTPPASAERTRGRL